MKALNRAQIFNPQGCGQAYQNKRLTALLSHQRALICNQKTALMDGAASQCGVNILLQPYGAGRKQKCCILATATPLDLDEGTTLPADSDELVEAGVGWFDWFDPFFRFSRPNTIIGSVLGVTSVSLMAIQSPADISVTFLIGLLEAIMFWTLPLPHVGRKHIKVMNNSEKQSYNVSLSSSTCVKSMINKPYLPLASGEYSSTTGIALVTTFAAVSLAIGAYVGSRPLMWALTISLVLGTAYSVDLPFLRWKRSAVAAASCILAVRAVVVQLGFYLHMQASVFRRAAVMTRPLWFITGFMCSFSVVRALCQGYP